MKKVLVGTILIFSIIMTGCTAKKNMVDYIDVSFSGLNTQGIATYEIDYEKLYKDTLDYKEDSDFPTDEILKEMENLSESFKVKLDKDKNLSNGDKINISISVNDKKTKLIKSGESSVIVEGLSEPQKLTTKDVEKYLVINFNGVSGRGESKIDNTLPNELKFVKFEIENEGKLKNGDEVNILLAEDSESSLHEAGYILEKEFSPKIKVSGLDMVASKAEDIKNLDDIKRMIDEGIKREYKSSPENKYSFDYQYEIKEERLLYRAFSNENDDSSSWFWGNSSNNGNLVKIFTIKRFTGGPEGKLEDQSTVIYGFSDIILDSNNNANVAEITEISNVKDNTYSLESVFKLYEGYGYTEVK